MIPPVDRKLARLRAGGTPRVLDLFSGCGGLMLGFQRAGCQSLAGVELDPDAARSYALNFHQDALVHQQSRDITKLRPKDFLKELGHGAGGEDVDLIIGGPPCPAFTRVGRAKLREIADDPDAYLNDPRAKLYLQYLDFVRELKPVALLMENVPDVLNFGGRNVGEEIAEALEAEGYHCRYTLLNAANYGVPQMRERFFLLAVRTEASIDIEFPAPSCSVRFPAGYGSSRRVALKHVPSQLGMLGTMHYVPRPEPDRSAGKWVTVRQAIEDLPAFLGRDVRRGPQRLDERLPYNPSCPLSKYARLMRTWPGFEGTDVLADHVTRALSERDFRLFKQMAEGDDYPKAKKLAERLYSAATSSKRLQVCEADYVPPYDATKFPNRWRKMESDAPARTLMAHLGKDTYSHIHYDGDQARTITVREAARLQSFPDGFRFSGTMNRAFKQIGNAVPPLLSLELATALLSSLGVRSLQQVKRSG